MFNKAKFRFINTRVIMYFVLIIVVIWLVFHYQYHIFSWLLLPYRFSCQCVILYCDIQYQKHAVLHFRPTLNGHPTVTSEAEVRRIYSWIYHTITHDVEASDANCKPKLNRQTLNDIIKNRKTTCWGYAELFYWMCRYRCWSFSVPGPPFLVDVK